MAARHSASEIVGGCAGAAARAWGSGAPAGRNFVICFHERTSASAKTSSRSPGLAHVQRCVDRFLLVGDDGDLLRSTRPRAISAVAIMRGTSSGPRSRRLSSRRQM